VSEPLVTVAREQTPSGEVALRRRGAVLELVVNGGFAMDTVDPSTEAALAAEALACHPAPARVLVAGLGLGFTTRAVLADPRVARVDVVELAAPIIRWARQSLVSELAGLEDDGRCRLHVGDVADVLTPRAGRAGPRGPWDLVLLDVDNGPDFLLHQGNARLYVAGGLRSARAQLAPGGVLAVWSSHVSPALLSAMEQAAEPRETVTEHVVVVTRGGRRLDYALYSLHRLDLARREGGDA
jgi:spermidine synthase